MVGLMALTFGPSSTSGQLDLLIILIIDNLTFDNFLTSQSLSFLLC